MCESDSETHGHTGTSGGLCFEETSLAQACVATTVHGGGCYRDCVDGDQESGEWLVKGDIQRPGQTDYRLLTFCP